jgi:hypothetical protein
MKTDLEQRAINRIGIRMPLHLAAVWVITGSILFSAMILIVIPIMIGLMSGIITGNIIYMYVVARSFEDD